MICHNLNIGDDDTVSIHSRFPPEKPRGFKEGNHLPWMSEPMSTPNFMVKWSLFNLELSLTWLLFACCREDRSALNKLNEAVKTNFNERFDEVCFLLYHHFKLLPYYVAFSIAVGLK